MKVGWAAVLLTVWTGWAAPADSLRLIQLEAQVKIMEAEKAKADLDRQKAEQERNLARITALETQVANLAKHQARIDNEALWTAGDKVQTSIWFSLASGGCFVIASLGAQAGNPGMALIGLGGAVTFNIFSIIRLYETGSNLKAASNP